MTVIRAKPAGAPVDSRRVSDLAARAGDAYRRSEGLTLAAARAFVECGCLVREARKEVPSFGQWAWWYKSAGIPYYDICRFLGGSERPREVLHWRRFHAGLCVRCGEPGNLSNPGNLCTRHGPVKVKLRLSERLHARLRAEAIRIEAVLMLEYLPEGCEDEYDGEYSEPVELVIVHAIDDADFDASGKRTEMGQYDDDLESSNVEMTVTLPPDMARRIEAAAAERDATIEACILAGLSSTFDGGSERVADTGWRWERKEEMDKWRRFYEASEAGDWERAEDVARERTPRGFDPDMPRDVSVTLRIPASVYRRIEKEAAHYAESVEDHIIYEMGWYKEYGKDRKEGIRLRIHPGLLKRIRNCAWDSGESFGEWIEKRIAPIIEAEEAADEWIVKRITPVAEAEEAVCKAKDSG